MKHPGVIAILSAAGMLLAPSTAPAQAEAPALIDLSRDTARHVIVDRQAGQYLGHPTTVLLEDGRPMVAVYPLGHGQGGIVMKRSLDGGLTWSTRLPVPATWATSKETPTIHRVVDAAGGSFGGIVAMSSVVPLKTLTGDRHVAAYAPDGRLFVTFRDMARDSTTAGDWVAWVGTFSDLVAGQPGQYRVRLMDNHHQWDCCYPGLDVLPYGTIVTTTYGYWTAGESPYIVSIRLKLAELDTRAQGK